MNRLQTEAAEKDPNVKLPMAQVADSSPGSVLGQQCGIDAGIRTGDEKGAVVPIQREAVKEPVFVAGDAVRDAVL